MDPQKAREHLEVIRTLMERSAVYRRALAPTALWVGGLGLVAAVVGWALGLTEARTFSGYWMGVALAGLAGTILAMRRQALRDLEPFWSPPARRVTQALMPTFLAGALAGVALLRPGIQEAAYGWWLPGVWMVLYGCGLHAAGFFMPRGIRVFGWLFMGLGGALVLWVDAGMRGGDLPGLVWAHGVMGATFGGLHLAYGSYLRFTSPRGVAP
jgi:hypothetical protein